MTRSAPGFKPFSYSEDALDALEASFSSDRLRTYLGYVGGDRARAFRIHAWNTAACAAFYGPLQGLELAPRNAPHRRLADRYGAKWYDNPVAGIDSGAARRIARAKESVGGGPRAISPSNIVAALTFGFWVSLLGPGGKLQTGRKADYEATLWRPALRRAFPDDRKLTREEIHKRMDNLRKLRDRIAHHEPIFQRRLDRDFENLLEAVGWLSSATWAWIAHHSRVPELLAIPKDAPAVRF